MNKKSIEFEGKLGVGKAYHPIEKIIEIEMKYSRHNMYFVIHKKEEPILFNKLIRFIKNRKIKIGQ